jgi:DNA transformation protein and related proteins
MESKENSMMELTQLPNIGKELKLKLLEAGIETLAQLKETGSENIFVRLATIDNSICINTLYAIEGAIQEIRWHQLSKDRKRELLDFYHLCKK